MNPISLVILCLTTPLIGYLTGLVIRFLDNYLAKVFIYFSLAALVVLISWIIDFSFFIDFIDYFLVLLTLFLGGFLASKVKNAKNRLETIILKILKYLLISYYISIPFIFIYVFFSAWNKDKMGRLVQIDVYGDTKLKHYCVNSNFSFSGYHIVNVYEKILLFEYKVKSYNVGKYGIYGFNTTISFDNKVEMPFNTFKYNLKSKKLEVLQYEDEKYVVVDIF